MGRKGAAQTKCKYQADWEDPSLHPNFSTWVKPVKTGSSDDVYFFSCKVCYGKLSLSNMGVNALTSHASSKGHQKKSQVVKKMNINTFLQSAASSQEQSSSQEISSQEQPSSSQTNGHSAPLLGTEVKVLNIPVGTDENKLWAHFGSSGEEITNIRILPVHGDEAAFTTGFVAFSSCSQARIAVEEKNDVEFKGFPLGVFINVPVWEGGGSNHSGAVSQWGSGVNGLSVVAVHNIPESTEEEALKSYCQSEADRWVATSSSEFSPSIQCRPEEDGRAKVRRTKAAGGKEESYVWS